MDEMDCLWLPIIKSWRLNEVSSRAFLLGARQFIFTDHYNVQKFRECTVI
jgi:hypothetical protein